jgi:hypothetical protein
MYEVDWFDDNEYLIGKFLEGIVVASLRLIPENFLEETEINHENYSQVSHCPGRISNAIHHRYWLSLLGGSVDSVNKLRLFPRLAFTAHFL